MIKLTGKKQFQAHADYVGYVTSQANRAVRRAGRQVETAVVAGGSMLAAMGANAALDMASVTAAITEAGAAVALIGAAVIVVKVGVKVYKWVAAAL